MATPFAYPDGSSVDIFLEHCDGQLWNEFLLSDYGQTGLHLHDSQVRIDSTSRRREIVKDICAELRVVYNDGNLEVRVGVEEPTDISDAILRLSQACIRIADLVYHQRLRSANPFRDDVEEFLDASLFKYEPDVKVPGPYGRDVRVDFDVQAGTNESYILLLAALNESAAHYSANEIFTKWYDLGIAGASKGHKLITVYNSLSEGIRRDDLERLQTVSSTVAYPEQEEALMVALGK
jgi:hypothetical protein